MEEWRPIEGYVGLYEVSNLGRVRRLDGTDARGHRIKGRVLKARRCSRGYSAVSLSNGTASQAMIHRLVAKAFVPNPHNKPDINHLDENKTNNAAVNLEWVTKSENMNWGSLPERMREITFEQHQARKKPVCMMTKDGFELAVFFSAADAERATSIKAQHISQCCTNAPYHLSAGGYKWKYASKQTA